MVVEAKSMLRHAACFSFCCWNRCLHVSPRVFDWSAFGRRHSSSRLQHPFDFATATGSRLRRNLRSGAERSKEGLSKYTRRSCRFARTGSIAGAQMAIEQAKLRLSAQVCLMGPTRLPMLSLWACACRAEEEEGADGPLEKLSRRQITPCVPRMQSTQTHLL